MQVPENNGGIISKHRFDLFGTFNGFKTSYIMALNNFHWSKIQKETSMKYIATIFVLLGIMVAPLGLFGNAQTASAASIAYTGIPTFSIVSVVENTSVTIKTHNFPPNDTFKVLMGDMGTRGVNGIKVATQSSGSGGSFTATYDIPAELSGQYRIAIRLQSTSGSGYFAYNWFYNDPSGTSGGATPPPGYSGFPTFSIVSVVQDSSVTILTKNLPPNDTFKVLMNYMGTRGKGGTQVATLDSGSGGAQTLTYNIPAFLVGQYQIAIRLQSTTGSGYFAYNWFYNNTSGGTVTPPPSGYTGFPTFSIVSVVRNTSVTIRTSNLPANDTFNVLMNYMGTRGKGGTVVSTLDTGAGGTQTLTYNIPSFLAGQYQIAIRLQSTSGSGYFAYNWFYNSTTP
jgi:hypothetical protein